MKDALISILIGALVAFLSSLFDGIFQLLETVGNDLVGGAAASVAYAAKHVAKGLLT